MKELSIEEKAKAYDGNYKAYTELISRLEDVKEAIKKKNYGIAMDVLCKPYPEFQVTTHSELKDEDERIRNFLIKQANSVLDSITDDDEEVPAWKSALAWLEKQGNLMKALQISNAKIGELIEKNYYLKEQLEKQGEPKKHDVCDNCEQQGSCVFPCPMKLVEKQSEQKLNVNDNAKEMFIKALERVEEQNNKGYKLTDCDRNSWWEDFKAYTSCIIEQNPAWSEEDERHIRELESLVKQVWLIAEHENDKDTIHKMSDLSFFLKTLKPQSKQEWSEEDDRMYNRIVSFIPQHLTAESYTACINWLKSLKDRYTWRPSYEQVSVLEFVMKDIEKDSIRYRVLNSVLEQLKKLRED